ncbi:MAG: hypothetical protein LBD04_09210 [Synergistaceae bacterium]|nr:hypothetical protein [Synergistaceae bacterium]
MRERLEKHWNNRNWPAFTSLFMRDKEASTRTPWVSRWGDALYNHLTAALFVDKDFQSTETLLALIRSEDKILFSSSLRDCADVAADYLYARKNASYVLSPLRDESRLPSPYTVLRGGLLSSAACKPKTRKADKSKGLVLVEKLAAQYSKLARAKMATPYTTWLKIAEQLEESAQGTRSANTFRAVRAIVALVREIFRKGKGENALRDVNDLARHPLFRAIPGGQTHPGVAALWDFFRRVGRQKYGEEWGNTACVLRFSFMESNLETEQLKLLYERLMKKNDDFSMREMLRDIMNAQWTEQERYILSVLYVVDFDPYESDALEFDQFFKSLEEVGRIGRKWRPQAPWPALIRESFQKVVLRIPPRLLLSVQRLPYEAMSAPTLVHLAMIDGKGMENIMKSIVPLLPLRFTKEESAFMVESFLEERPSHRNLRLVRSLLTQVGYAALLTEWVNALVEKGEIEVLNDVPVSRQTWANMSRELMEELTSVLPPSSVEGCLCHLRLGVKPRCLSNDPEKVEAFFRALPSNSPLGTRLLPSLLTWSEVDPLFIVRLFKEVFASCKDQRNGDNYLCVLAELVSGMTNKANQKIVAVRMCELLTEWNVKDRSPYYHDAVESLEILAGQRQPLPEAKKKAAFRDEEVDFKKMWDFFSKVTGKRGRLDKDE